MSRTVLFFRLIVSIGVFYQTADFYHCTANAQDFSRIDAVEKVVADKFSGKQDFAQAEAELVKLWNQLTTTREPAAGSREAKVFDRIGELLVKVRARATEPYAGGSGRQTALPIPHYAENKLIGQIVLRLRKSQVELLTQLRADADSKKAKDLLIAVVLAQEDLAWEVGWPFTDEEIKAYRIAGELTKEIYLSRRNRGVEQINMDLKADFEAVGRESSRGFTIFSPPADDDKSSITTQLKKKRGEAGSAWREGTVVFNDAFLKSLFQR